MFVYINLEKIDILSIPKECDKDIFIDCCKKFKVVYKEMWIIGEKISYHDIGTAIAATKLNNEFVVLPQYDKYFTNDFIEKSKKLKEPNYKPRKLIKEI